MSSFDPDVFVLYHLATRHPWAAYGDAADLLEKKPADPHSLLRIQERALESILEDLGEHGDANADKYDDHPPAYFEKELKTVRGRIAKSDGASSAWAEYVAKADALGDDERRRIVMQVAMRMMGRR